MLSKKCSIEFKSSYMDLRVLLFRAFGSSFQTLHDYLLLRYLGNVTKNISKCCLIEQIGNVTLTCLVQGFNVLSNQPFDLIALIYIYESKVEPYLIAHVWVCIAGTL